MNDSKILIFQLKPLHNSTRMQKVSVYVEGQSVENIPPTEAQAKWPVRRPTYRWLDEVQKDLRELQTSQWEQIAQDALAEPAK